jgi:hypothetical protein
LENASLEKPLNPLQKMALELNIDFNEQHLGLLNFHIPTELSHAETVPSILPESRIFKCIMPNDNNKMAIRVKS